MCVCLLFLDLFFFIGKWRLLGRQKLAYKVIYRNSTFCHVTRGSFFLILYIQVS